MKVCLHGCMQPACQLVGIFRNSTSAGCYACIEKMGLDF
jgi:hypothetical protein